MQTYRASKIVAAATFTGTALHQMVADRFTHLVPALADNPTLSEQVWWDLYGGKRKPAAALAESLAARELTPAQLEHVITHDGRSTIVVAALGSGQARALPRHLAEHLIASKAWGPKLADAVLAVGVAEQRPDDQLTTALDEVFGADAVRQVPADLFPRIAATRSGAALLDWWASGWGTLAVPDADVLATLSGDLSAGVWTRRATKVALTALFGMRPALVPGAIELARTSGTLRFALADHRELTVEQQHVIADWDPQAGALRTTISDEAQWALMKLVNSPAVDLSLVAGIREATKAPANGGAWKLGQSIDSRMSRRPYRVEGPWEDVRDEGKLEWLLSRTLPSRVESQDWETGEYRRTKVRWYDLPALAANPHLPAPMVQLLADRLRLHELTEWPAHVVELLTQRFHDAGTTNAPELSVDPYDAPHPVLVPNPDTHTQPINAQYRADIVPNLNVALNSVWTDGTVAYLRDQLGENLAQWELLLAMVDEHTGTIGDLVALCQLADVL